MPTSAEILNSLYSQYTTSKTKSYLTEEQKKQQSSLFNSMLQQYSSLGTATNAQRDQQDSLYANMLDRLNTLGSSTPRTAEQRKQQAENEYKSYYDALRLAAKQGYNSTDLKLQQQREGLQASYDKQRKDTAEQYAKSYSQADRQMLSRGMQRSTYTSQLLAGISNEAAEAQSDIDAAQIKATSDIDEQRTQLASQLAEQMQQYTASEQSDILKRIAELEEQDRQYGLNEASLQQSMAKDLYTLLADRESQDRQYALNMASTQYDMASNLYSLLMNQANQERQFDLNEASIQSGLGETLYSLLKEKEDADAAAAAAKKSPVGRYTPPPPTDNNVGDDKEGAMSWEQLRAKLEAARQRAVAATEEKNKQIATENKSATGALRTKYMAKKETK